MPEGGRPPTGRPPTGPPTGRPLWTQALLRAPHADDAAAVLVELARVSDTPEQAHALRELAWVCAPEPRARPAESLDVALARALQALQVGDRARQRGNPALLPSIARRFSLLTAGGWWRRHFGPHRGPTLRTLYRRSVEPGLPRLGQRLLARLRPELPARLSTISDPDDDSATPQQASLLRWMCSPTPLALLDLGGAPFSSWVFVDGRALWLGSRLPGALDRQPGDLDRPGAFDRQSGSPDRLSGDLDRLPGGDDDARPRPSADLAGWHEAG